MPVPAHPGGVTSPTSSSGLLLQAVRLAANEDELYEVKGGPRHLRGAAARGRSLVEVMDLRNQLRALRMRGLKWAGRLIAQLGPDAALIPEAGAAGSEGERPLPAHSGMELVQAIEQPPARLPAPRLRPHSLPSSWKLPGAWSRSCAAALED